MILEKTNKQTIKRFKIKHRREENNIELDLGIPKISKAK